MNNLWKVFLQQATQSGKIEANDKFSLSMQRKESWRASLYCMRKPGENPDMKWMQDALNVIEIGQ